MKKVLQALLFLAMATTAFLVTIMWLLVVVFCPEPKKGGASDEKDPRMPP